MPFTKVVEQYEIYNFSIIHLVHFCSKILSLGISNRAKSNSTRCRRHAFAPARDVVRVATPGRATGRPDTTARAPLRSSVPRPPTDVRAQPSVATRCTLMGRAKPTYAAQPTALPSYPGSARARRRRPHRPCLDSCGLCALAVTPKHELLFKGRSSPVARVTARHRAMLRHAPLKARCRAPPSTCSPSQGTLLALALDRPEARTLACCPGRATPLTGARVLAAAAEHPPVSSIPTRSPGQPTLPGPPLGRREANCATRCVAPSLSLPESEQPWPPSPVSAAPAHRSNSHSPICGQSTLGEGNRAPESHV
jgi:hypothetical protein